MKAITGNILAFTMLTLIVLSIFACENKVTGIQKDDKLLAQAYGRSLYLSEINEFLPADATDSTLITNAYIEKWVREALLMHEAEMNIPKDLNIDDLVRDYRSSLILHNYENYLIREELDSTITEEELTLFYEQNKEQYQLKNPILRCRLIKIPLTAQDLENCTHWWNSSADADKVSLSQYCAKNAEVFLLNDKSWYDAERIINYFPNGVLTTTNFQLKENFIYADQFYKYYLSVLEVVTINQPPPLAYIENQAKKVILHQRKMKLLENKRETLYEEEKNRNNVKIYNQ